MCVICDNEYEGLNSLALRNCEKVTTIPIIEGLRWLYISNCQNITNIHTTSKYSMKRFNSINKIKRWYKRIKLSKKLWMYAELVIMDSMNPHKENNSYLKNYINDKVYK